MCPSCRSSGHCDEEEAYDGRRNRDQSLRPVMVWCVRVWMREVKVCVCVLCVRVWECEDDGGTRIVFKKGQAATEVGSATPSRGCYTCQVQSMDL